MRSIFKDFIKNVKSMSQLEKIKRIYALSTGHKPSSDLKPDKILNRIIYEQRFGAKINDTEKFQRSKKNKFKWKGRSFKALKASNKPNFRNKVLVVYLNVKNEMEPPKLYPLYQGNMVIIKNKPYEVDPRAFWTSKQGKTIYKCLLIKEIDRRPVSNLDYSEIKKRGDATDSDDLLIRATLKAYAGAVKKSLGTGAIVFIVIAILAVVGFMFFGGGA